MNFNTLENQQNQKTIAHNGQEKELLDINQLFEGFMSSTIFAIAIIDKNHKIIRVNPLFAKYFKKPIESFVGKYCYLESEKSEYICSHCPGIKAMISGKTEVAETQGVRDDGSHFDARICAVPFYNSDNEVAGFIEMVEDITKVKQDEARLIESEEKYRKQFEGALDAIFLADTETGILIDCNQAALKLVGREKTEIIGQHQRILHPSDTFDGKFTKEFEEHLRCDENKVIETKVITRDGENKDVAIKACVIEINGEKVLQGIFRDITENKQKEREFQKVQEELIEASRRAGMAEVAADVLHNVGNVLNSINVTTTLIKDTLSKSEISNLKKVTDMIEGQLGNLDEFFNNDPKGKHIPAYLKEVVLLLTQEQQDVVEKLKTLIEDINHIKTIINMQQEYTKVLGAEVTITIEHVIESALRINQASLKRHNIRFVKECTDLDEVNINKNSVIQILVNLIANAKNALLESDVIDKVLTIRSYNHDDKHLRIEVTDNGVGISQENLTKLFQHGFTTRKDGHGFGLHSSILAAKEMNGSLTVHSEGLGHGATFTLELPLKLANTCWIDDKPIKIS
ncbi:MAG: PAS domain-containing sensor histidine kinase [Sedimentisphaerales bacterium]|nr:PAS domain-containing sensor histidine kinase [Sedimentisphaerales bacterium]